MNSLARDADDDQQQPRNEPTTAHAQTSSQQPQNPFPPPPPQQQPPCPRCGSTNTKFCYYNNYSLSQPRYICKGCRRYWTHGGSLRNVPVGGGSRKPKRPRLSSSTPATTTTSTESIQVVHQQRDEPTVPTTLTIGDDIVPAATAVLATSVSPPSSSLTYQMVNLINPNYHNQLSCGGVGGFDQGGSFLSSLMAVQSMAGGYTHSFHPSLASSNYHTLISSRNSGSGIFDFSSVDRSHHDDQPRLDFLTSDVQHLQANHTQAGVVSSVDARFWSVGGGGGGEVSRHGDKTNKDEEMVSGGGGSTGGGSSRVPPPQ